MNVSLRSALRDADYWDLSVHPVMTLFIAENKELSLAPSQTRIAVTGFCAGMPKSLSP